MSASDMILQKELHTSTAFDNFDRFIESLKNQTTMNDTVGIAVQDVIEDIGELEGINESDHEGDNSFSNQESTTSLHSTCTSNKRKRRSFKSILLDIPNYFKKPKICKTLQPYSVHERCIVPSDLVKANKIDILWMMSHYLQVQTPMWVGFNSKIIPDDSINKQKVSYLTPINKSPTDRAVV